MRQIVEMLGEIIVYALVLIGAIALLGDALTQLTNF